MSGFDDFMNGLSNPTNGSGWSAFGLGGKGHPGALGSWDVIGQGLDRANPAQGVDTAADAANAQSYLGGVTGAFDKVKAPAFSNVNLQGPAQAPDAQASRVGPSAMGDVSVNQTGRQAQTAQIAALQQLAKNGGRNAASDANLAEIEQNENQNARAQRDAALQRAAQRGGSGNGASLLADLDAGQAAVTRQNQGDLGVSGQEANTALAAGGQAASLGSNLEAQDFGEQAAKAQAQDAVDRFNSGNTTQVSEFNANKNQGVNNATAAAQNEGQIMNNYELPQTGFQDEMGLAGAKGGAAKQGLDYWNNMYNTDTKTKANVLGSGIQGAAAMFGAAFGGKTPGQPIVPGNSTLNDFVPIMSSPGEVHVPPALVQSGTPKEIGQYVKHAPTLTPDPAHNKEAMLSALKRLRTRKVA